MRMLMRSLIPLIILAAAAVAQPFGGPWASGATPEALKSALNLTDDQITKLRELRKAEWEALAPIREQLRANRQAYREKLQAGGDPAEIGKLALAGQQLRQKAQQVRESYHKQALAVLTPAQQSALAKLEEAAKLAPAVGQARALNLITGPALGPGLRGRFGLGFGPGPMGEAGAGPGAGPGPGPMGWRGWRRGWRR